MKRGWTLLLAAWLGLLAMPGWAAPEDKPVFYRLDYQGHQAWLLGSIHVGLPDFYPMPERIEQALSGAEQLVLEADPNDPNIQALVMQNMLATSPLPAELATQLQEFCQAQQLHCDPRLRPWMLSSQIAMGMMAQAGFRPDLGVEQQLMAQLKDRPVLELEGMAFQLEVFNSFSDEASHAMLKATLETSGAEEIEALVGAWREGDKEELAEQMLEGLQNHPELWQKLMLDRNVGMSEGIQALMQQHDHLFIAVGAGHLVGEGSIPSLLGKAGVQVTDCWQSDCQR